MTTLPSVMKDQSAMLHVPPALRVSFFDGTSGCVSNNVSAAVDRDLFVRKDQQISLFGVEFERYQPSVARRGADIAQPRAARDAAGGLDEDVVQRQRAVLVRLQIAAPEQRARNLPRGEGRFHLPNAYHLLSP
jgi:hypothetical protein